MRNRNATFRVTFSLLGAKLWLEELRPTMSYRAPLLAETSKMLITELQRLQNKLFRDIANVDRYISIRRIYEVLQLEYYESYITKLSIL